VQNLAETHTNLQAYVYHAVRLLANESVTRNSEVCQNEYLTGRRTDMFRSL